MEKGTKVALWIGGAILIGGAIATIIYVSKRKKEEDGVKDLDKISSDQVSDSSKAQVGDHTQYDQDPNIQKLKNNLGKAYYAMEILENRNGIVINKITGNPVANGLDQGTWIQLKKRKNELRDEIRRSNAISPVKDYGNKLISKLDRQIDAIFNPNKYNITQNWYLDYVKKYPEGIKGQA